MKQHLLKSLDDMAITPGGALDRAMQRMHPLAGQHINQGSFDAAADAYEAEYNAAHAFKREPRYVVFKITDIQKYITPAGIEFLQGIGESIAEGRKRDGKPPFNAVVVEQDWPEFEPTWAAIEARMTGHNVQIEARRAFAASLSNAGLDTGTTEER